jgi:hypothetical protein
VNEIYAFYPPKRAGMIFHLSAIALLTLLGAAGFWQAMHANVGPVFLLYLLPFLIALPLVPFLIFRLNNLENASYTLARDSLTLRWGLRLEVIPMNTVQWVRPASDLQGTLRLPRLRWPGAVLGTRRLPGGSTVIEFMASQTDGLLVVAAPGRLIAISPENPDAFLRTYQHFIELGSLLPPTPQSVHPTVVITRVWRSRPARFLTLGGALLSLGLLVWVSLLVPGLSEVSLGFLPDGTPHHPVPGIRLMLLPLLNGFSYVLNLFLGVAFFRREETQALAYLLWAASIFVSVLFFAAVYFSVAV